MRRLRATERQFIRLVGSVQSNRAQFFVYPFSLSADRSQRRDARAYIERYYYVRFEHASPTPVWMPLIITGANVANPALEDEAFWDPFDRAVVNWA